MNDLYMLGNSNKEMEIAGDKRLIFLVKFFTSKLDELDQERKKEELMNNVISKLKFLLANK